MTHDHRTPSIIYLSEARLQHPRAFLTPSHHTPPDLCFPLLVTPLRIPSVHYSVREISEYSILHPLQQYCFRLRYSRVALTAGGTVLLLSTVSIVDGRRHPCTSPPRTPSPSSPHRNGTCWSSMSVGFSWQAHGGDWATAGSAWASARSSCGSVLFCSVLPRACSSGLFPMMFVWDPPPSITPRVKLRFLALLIGRHYILSRGRHPHYLVPRMRA